MKPKKAFLMGETIVKLVVAVLVSLVLIALGVTIYNFAVPDTSKKAAEQELNSLNLELKTLSTADPGPYPYLSLKTPEWYLFSVTKGDICQDKFCLCICESLSCDIEDEQACIPTEKFVSVRLRGREERIIPMPKPPTELKITYINENVFPYDAVKEQYSAVSIPMLFYKFQNNEWVWSPDLENWMSTQTTEVTGGIWNKDEPTKENAEFIKVISGRNEQEGRGVLNIITSESNGAYRIEL